MVRLLVLFPLALSAAVPSRSVLRPVVFEPGAHPHQYVSHGSKGSLSLTRKGIEFSSPSNQTVRLELEGSRLAEPSAEKPLPSVSHYYLGNDPVQWRTNVPNFGEVRYAGVYPGIDLVFHGSGSGNTFEYDFEVAPHADPACIRLRFRGARLSQVVNGDLNVGPGLTQRKPRVMQGEHEIAGAFRIRRDGAVSFDLDSYDSSRPLVIDPVIVYSSYLGGSSGDVGSGVNVDKAGNVYMAGNTFSADIPGAVPFGARPRDTQTAFLTKYAPIVGGKTQLLFTIFLGDNGSLGYSQAQASTVDPSGNIIITGDTSALGFPTKNAIQTKLGGGMDCALSDLNTPTTCTDAFLTKFSGDGTNLIFSTFYGGKYDNSFDALTTDSAGNIYAAGFGTGITDLQGTPNAIQPTASGTQDMMIARFDPNGKVLYSTYLGGSGDDVANSIFLEKTGVVWVGGIAGGPNMPMPSPNKGFQTEFSGIAVAAYFARIDMTQGGAAGLTYATYFNGKVNTDLVTLFLDPAGQVVFCGNTISDLPTTSNAIEPGFIGIPLKEIDRRNFTTGDGYIARINPAVSGSASLTYASYVGGSDYDSVRGCGLDPKGNFVLSGYSGSVDLFLLPNFGIPYKFFTMGSSVSIFLIQIDPTKAGAAGIVGSFLVGGDDGDYTGGMAIDPQGFAYLAGYTFSHQFPVSTNAVQRKYGGDDHGLLSTFGLGDAWVMQVDLNQAQGNVTQLTQASGDYQFGAPGSTLAAPIAVQLSDAAGNPLNIPGFPIKMVTTGATVTPSQPFTDASGIATANVQITGDATIVASIAISGAESLKGYTFHLKSLSGTPPKSVAIVSGDKQSGAAGAPVAQPLVVELRDVNNAPMALAGITVQFKPANAKVSSATVVTDATGRASTNVTLGTAAGASTVQVVVGNLAVVTATYSITSGAAPLIAAGGIVNGATFKGGAISPGLIVTVFGSGIGPATLAVNAAGSDNKFSTVLAATRVLFDGVAAPIIYASAGQTSAIVPYSVTGKSSTQVTVEYQGLASSAATVAVAAAQLGLFSANSSGSGQGAILNQDNSINSSSNPAKRGSIVVLFGTGEGQTNPAGIDGLLATATFPKPLTPITVKIGSANSEVLYYGAAPTLVAGVLQVNVKIPSGIPDGDATIQLFEGSNQSPATITVAVRGDQ